MFPFPLSLSSASFFLSYCVVLGPMDTILGHLEFHWGFWGNLASLTLYLERILLGAHYITHIWWPSSSPCDFAFYSVIGQKSWQRWCHCGKLLRNCCNSSSQEEPMASELIGKGIGSVRFAIILENEQKSNGILRPNHMLPSKQV